MDSIHHNRQDENIEPLKKVKDFYVGTVCDNIVCNRFPNKITEGEYLKLFTSSCYIYVADLAIEDVCKVEK